ncbi:uncharacterized protein DUF4231 [Mycoplasmopsis mustelae]|uniref:Uncharacterized protein DUF4231 n=1 Tax=Mycoplasmopsis mustelae TaxID=171289 RepID=A0A4R7UD64_9BACT|nr:DUF4231 domain-containing protein [Mycoplasmopsis mustelae]TDV24359.1 uncharacterized protein DUF4231 [Mycoplasmopsis mustelae]
MIHKKDLTPRQLYTKILKYAQFKKYIYGVLYYILNLTSIVTAFYLSVLAIQFLAGNNKFFGNNNSISDNPYNDPYFNDGNNYILLTTIINSSLSLVSGILSFFVVNNKFIFYKKKVQQLKMEYSIYKSKTFIYKEEQATNRFLLYKRALQILEVDRYKSTALLDVSIDVKIKKGVKNEKNKENL